MKTFLALLLFVLPSCVGMPLPAPEPLSRVESGRGMLVLDGHDRVVVTQDEDESKTLSFTSIPWNWFN